MADVELEKKHPSRTVFFVCFALVVLTFVAFEPVRHNQFINFDDSTYVTRNENVNGGIDADSVFWAFKTFYAANWHPLTWLSHMLDCELFGLDSSWHHLVNLFFHITNTLVLFVILRRMTGAFWPSAFVAAAFALHPVHVESVAWLAERKDVLSGLFFMLAIAAYILYVDKPCPGRFLVVFVVFALGLMAKPMLVTLPFVLLLLDYWPLRRFNRQGSALRLVAEKLPLFILSVISCILTFIAQSRYGAIARMEYVPISYRVSNALVSYVRYLGKMIYPARLAILYPNAIGGVPVWQGVVCFLFLTGITVWAICMIRRRYLLVGWLWYLGMLVSVIGLVQVGNQAMADRYTYLPSIGVFIIVAWGAADLAGSSRARKVILAVLAAFALVGFTLTTRRQARLWRDNFKLYEHTLSITKDNYKIDNNYGIALAEKGRLDEAIVHFDRALSVWPDFLEARVNLARGYLLKQSNQKTIDHCKKAIQLNPNYEDTYQYLGRAYAQQGKYDLAIEAYKNALQLKPDYLNVKFFMGQALTKQGKYNEAVRYFTEVMEEAPDWPGVYYSLAVLYDKKMQPQKAIEYYYKTLELEPDQLDSLVRLAWLLATNKNAEYSDSVEAVRMATRACELTDYQKPEILSTLSAAYAATGQYDKALETAQKALPIAQSSKNELLVDHIQRQIERYTQAKQ